MTTDKDLIKERFESSFLTYNELAHVQRRICNRLADRATTCCGCGHDVKRAFEIGAGTGFLTHCLISIWPRAKYFLNDLIPTVKDFIDPQTVGVDIEYLWGDAENIDYPSNLDLIASTSTIQWFGDKVGFARKTAAALNHGGYLAISLFGPENFREIRATTGEGLRYLALTELCTIFEQAGFRILHAEEYTEILSFDTPRDALKYIKSLGINSVKKTSWNAGKMEEFDAAYRRMFPSPDGGITLTYHPQLIIAQRI